jgi:hypothetical protein
VKMQRARTSPMLDSEAGTRRVRSNQAMIKCLLFSALPQEERKVIPGEEKNGKIDVFSTPKTGQLECHIK